MEVKKILVYGAGPLGSIFAAKLKQGGHDVSLLARGQRFKDLEAHGIVLKDFYTKEVNETRVNVVAALKPDDVYDLIMVIMRKNNAIDILNVLKNNTSQNILFMMNNFAGPGVFVDALGKDRVLTGFPSSAGYREGHMVHMLAGSKKRPMVVPFGEVDGAITPRTREIAGIINSMPWYKADIRTDIDNWLKYHVAFLFPALAPALFFTKLDKFRLARTPDLLILVIRGIREAFKVLKAGGVSLSPGSLRIFTLLPEPMLVSGLKKRIVSEVIDIALIGHAKAIGDEVTHLLTEFMVFKNRTSVPTPALDRILTPYLEGKELDIPEGSAAIPMNWGGVIAGIAAVLAIIGVVLLMLFQG